MLSTGAQGNLDLLYVQQGDPKLHVKYVWQWELSQQFPPVVNGLRDGLVADLCKALWVNVGPAEQHLLFVNQRHEAVPYLGFFRGCEGAQVIFTHAHDCHGVGPREGVAARTTHVAKGVMARIVEFRPLPRDQSAATFPVLELLTGPHEGQHLLCPRKRLQDQERIGRAALTAATQKAHRRRVALIRAALRWGEAASSTSFRGTQAPLRRRPVLMRHACPSTARRLGRSSSIAHSIGNWQVAPLELDPAALATGTDLHAQAPGGTLKQPPLQHRKGSRTTRTPGRASPTPSIRACPFEFAPPLPHPIPLTAPQPRTQVTLRRCQGVIPAGRRHTGEQEVD